MRGAVDSRAAESVVAELRALQAARPMDWDGLQAVAEGQAALLLERLRIDRPPVPQCAISDLPGIVVDHRASWPTSGMAVRLRDQWRIVIRAEEPRQRQRFSLAHEFKHVLDDPIIEQVFPDRTPDSRHERAERLCDHFAACLLMPREWVLADWRGGIHDVEGLARRYDVSAVAMTTRLAALGLISQTNTEPNTASL